MPRNNEFDDWPHEDPMDMTWSRGYGIGFCVVVVCVLLFCIWATQAKKNKEVNVATYGIVEMMLDNRPEIAGFVADRYADGKISSSEFYEISDEAERLDEIEVKAKITANIDGGK